MTQVSSDKTLFLTQEAVDRILFDLQKAQRASFHLSSLERGDDVKRAETLLALGKLYLFDMCLRSRVRIISPPPPESTAVVAAELDLNRVPTYELGDDLVIYDDEPIYDRNRQNDTAKKRVVVLDGDSEDTVPAELLTKECQKLGKRSYSAFAKARKLQPSQWVYPYMLARASLKLQKSQRKTLKLLQEAVEVLDKSTGKGRRTKDRQAFEPFYRLHSTRLKFLRQALQTDETGNQVYGISDKMVCTLSASKFTP